MSCGNLGMAVHDDLIPILDDAPSATAAPPWQVLVVDDVQSICEITRIILQTHEVLGRPIQVTTAHSCAECIALLASRPQPSFDLALVDMIMECEDAGLRLVQHIRSELNDGLMRLIIRTGQPGFSEESHMPSLDIDGFVAKTDLDATRLRTVVAAQLRSLHRAQQHAAVLVTTLRRELLAALDAGDLDALRQLLDRPAGG